MKKSQIGPPDKLRICLLGYRSNPFSGGQGVYMNYLSKALVEIGHSVDVISGPPYPVLDERITLYKMPSKDLYSKKVPLKALRFKDFFIPGNFIEWLSVCSGGFPEPYTFGIRVSKYLSRNKSGYDIIHDNQSLCYGLLDIQKKGMPTLATIHHPITVDKELAIESASTAMQKVLINRWYAFLGMQKKVAKNINNLITVSQRAKQDIAVAFGVSENKINVIHNGIDTKIFSSDPKIKRLENRLIVTASADAPLKGLDHLLESLASLRTCYHDLELVVIGKMRENGHTHRLINRLGIDNCVKFLNGIDNNELVKQYAMATIAVVPSLYEGFGLPAGEAMACGVPVVSTTGGALPEVVGDAGILVPPADSQALTMAITELLESPDKRMQLSIAGRERIIKNFNWRDVALKVADIYRQTIIQVKKY